MHVGISRGYNYNMRSNYISMYIVYTNSNPNSLYPIMIHDAYPDYIVIKLLYFV